MIARTTTAAAVLISVAGPVAAAVVSWTPEVNLSQTTTDSETGLNHRPLAVTADGVFHVVWAERDTPNQQYRIWTKRLEDGDWTAAELVVNYLATDPGDPGDDIGAKYPALAATTNGDLHLFWHDYRIAGIDNVEIFTKMRPGGGAWDSSRTADVRLTTTMHPEVLGDNGYVPVPVSAPDGAVHVAWYDYRFDGSHAEILAKTRPAGGAWDLTPGDSADVRVTNDADHSELVAADVDSAGGVHVAWRSIGAGPAIRYARRDEPTGVWSAPEEIDDGGAVQGAPALAVDASGAVHVVWPDAREGGRALFTNVKGPAGAWTGAERITRPEHAADEPSLSAGTDGVLHLAWSDGRFSLFNREIFHRAKPPGAPWDSSGASDFRVSVASASSTRPSVLAHGPLVSVVWKDLRNGNHEIYFRRGGPAGTAAPARALEPSPGLVASPNPGRGRVRIRRADGGPVAPLRILDVGGRIVRTLRADGPESRWDGRTDAGRLVPAGVYFVRAADRGSSLRLTVLR